MGDRLATKAEGPAVPLSIRGAGFPSNMMLPGPRPTSIPSGILIHPTVSPQYTNVTDTDKTDNGPIAQGEPLLVTVAKMFHGLL